MSPVNNDEWELMSQIMRPGGHLLLGTSEENAWTSLVAHIEKHDWLETCHMETEMPSGFTKKSDRQLRQADYNRLQPHIHRMVKLSYIYYSSYIWQNYRTNRIIIVQLATMHTPEAWEFKYQRLWPGLGGTGPPAPPVKGPYPPISRNLVETAQKMAVGSLLFRFQWHIVYLLTYHFHYTFITNNKYVCHHL